MIVKGSLAHPFPLSIMLFGASTGLHVDDGLFARNASFELQINLEENKGLTLDLMTPP
jgi:hypothetical protein